MITITIEAAEGYSAKQVAQWIHPSLHRKWVHRVTIQDGDEVVSDDTLETIVIDRYGTERWKWTDMRRPADAVT